MRLVHLTDPHLATPPPWRSLVGRSHLGKRFLGYASWARKRRWHLRPEWLQELVHAVDGLKPDQRLISGDLAQIGTAEEIEAAGRWLAGFAPPEQVVLVPGNHDVYAADSWPSIIREWARYVPEGGAYPLVKRCADVAVFGLSTAVPTAPPFATGLVGRDQLARLETALAGHRDAFRVLLLHHPPLPQMISRRKRLEDAPALAALLDRAPVHLVLHGHRHENQDREHHGTRIFCTAPASAETASFRSFDILHDSGGLHDGGGPRGWTVRAALYQRRPAGGFEETDVQQWTVSAPG